jgi:hypothetical protein
MATKKKPAKAAKKKAPAKQARKTAQVPEGSPSDLN